MLDRVRIKCGPGPHEVEMKTESGFDLLRPGIAKASILLEAARQPRVELRLVTFPSVELDSVRAEFDLEDVRTLALVHGYALLELGPDELAAERAKREAQEDQDDDGESA